MALTTLKALHSYLALLEDQPALKRHLPAYANPRTVKEGLAEIARLVGLEPTAFDDPRALVTLIGAPRFVLIWGTPSVTDQVARAVDGARVLLTVMIDRTHFEMGASTGRAQAPQEPGAPSPAWGADPLPLADTLKPLLSGNVKLTSRLFRAVFEHMLGFVSSAGGPTGNVLLVSEFCGSREHSRSFLATALFILGAVVDRENLMSFMVQEDLFGLPVFEHMLHGRDYCDAFHSFRQVERAFTGPPVVEASHLRRRLDQFNADFGGAPCGAAVFEAAGCDKQRIDAHLAAADLLEALALTPWCMSLSKAVSVDPCASSRSVSVIATQFERVSRGQATKADVNRDIADHLLAFARQFLADPIPA